jgi:hypothetical protein
MWTSGHASRVLTRPFLVLLINRGPVWHKYGGATARDNEAWLRARTAGSTGLSCLYRSLVAPNAELLRFLAPWLPAFTPPNVVVGVHIRQGDAAMVVKAGGKHGAMRRGSSSMRGYFTAAADNARFLRCARTLRDARVAELAAAAAAAVHGSAAAGRGGAEAARSLANATVRVLLVSDAESARNEGRVFFGGGPGSVLLDTGIRAQHTSWVDRKVHGRKFLGDRMEYEASVLRTAVAEWALLTMASDVVLHRSGFSRTAAAFGSWRNVVHMAMEGCRVMDPFELARYGAGI